MSLPSLYRQFPHAPNACCFSIFCYTCLKVSRPRHRVIGRFATLQVRHLDVSLRIFWRFDTRTFRYLNGRFATGRQRNSYSIANYKLSDRWRNVRGGSETSWYRNVQRCETSRWRTSETSMLHSTSPGHCLKLASVAEVHANTICNAFCLKRPVTTVGSTCINFTGLNFTL